MEKIISQETIRFMSEVQEIINKTPSLSLSKIALSAGYKSQDFTDIKSGKKKLQRKFLDDVAKIYEIDTQYVLTGTRKNEPSDSLLKEEAAGYMSVQSQLNILTELVNNQKLLIELLRSENARLKAELFKGEDPDKSATG